MVNRFVVRASVARVYAFAFAFAFAFASVAPAFAQSVDDAARITARDLGYEGVALFEKGDFAAAYDRLRRAYAVLHAPTLGLWEARSLVKLGRLVEASELYLEVERLEVSASAPQVQRKAQQEAATERAVLAARIASVVIRLEGAASDEVAVTLDGKAVQAALIGAKRPVDPGAHRVEGKRGGSVVAADFSVREGEPAEVTVRFDAAPLAPTAPVPEPTPARSPAAEPDSRASAPSRARWQPTAGWGSVGVGGALLVTSAVAWGVALGKKADLACSDGACSPDQRDAVDAYMTLRTVSMVGFWGGVVGLAAGTVLLVTSPRAPAAGRVALWPAVGLGSTGVSGTF